MRTSAPLLLAASLAVVSCSGGGTESPRPASMDPSRGSPGAPTPVVIHGDGFLVRPSQSQSGGGAAVDTRHRAWLDGVELDAVTWVDFHTLQAIVPAGLPDGPKQLVVENALGERGSLDAAYTVSSTQSAALLATLAAQPATVTVGQPTTVTLSVHNAGGSPVTALTPSALTVGGLGGTNATISPPRRPRSPSSAPAPRRPSPGRSRPPSPVRSPSRRGRTAWTASPRPT